MSTVLGNTTIEKFEDVVYPLNICQRPFTVGVIDNIDINPTSTTGMLCLHETAASLHQKVIDPSKFQSRERSVLSTETFLKHLTLDYTEIEPLHLPSTTPQPDILGPPVDIELDFRLLSRRGNFNLKCIISLKLSFHYALIRPLQMH